MERLRILLIDDDELARETLAGILSGHDVEEAADIDQAESALDGGPFDVCFIDLQIGKGDGLPGLKIIPLAKSNGAYSVVMSGFDSDGVVDAAYDAGCDDFFAKGNEAANVDGVIEKFYRQKSGFDLERIFSREFITQDPMTRTMVLEALKYAATDLPILILGPSGTGKTRLAEILHEHSRREGPFVAINCAAYPEDLLEVELFGHKKGAFTGALDERKGKLLQAHKGTLFLDEIGAMSPKMQSKLLKAVEERTFYPVGSDKTVKSEFRIMSATLENLKRLIAEDRMRFDLFQRISGMTVNLTPLVRRPCDILPMIRFFTRKKRRLSFSDEAIARLERHPWPGNARELRKFVDRLVDAPGGRLGRKDIETHLAITEENASDGGLTTEKHYRYARDHGLQALLDKCAEEVISRNLRENGGKKTHVLRDLQISSRLLYSTIRREDSD